MAKAKKNNYWKQRFDQIEQAANNQSVEYIQSLEEKYRKAAQAIDGKINAWYQRLAANNGVSMTEARRMLTDSELKEFKWTVEEYIKAGQENAIDERWMKELENASAKMHISRLEALKMEARQQIEFATGGMVDSVDGLLKSVYADTFYQSCFVIQAGLGVGFDISGLDNNRVSKILSKPWSVDGTNFSEKLWGNKAKLINSLDQELSRMVITGESPRKAIENIRKTMGVSQNAAARLVMTEQAYFTTVAQKDAYGELDVEEYEYVGTLDGTTCSECGDLDGEHFPLSEMQPGINAPPMHPYCRCTTCPYFDDEFTDGMRASRDEEGKTVYEVPENMTYNEWKDSFVDDGSKDGLTRIDNNGKIATGGRILDPDSAEGKAFAEMYYSEIRSFSTDSEKIAYNLCKEKEEIEKIKQYLFFNHSFEPDCAIAQSWQRLMLGENIQKHDRTLIEHELLEMQVKRDNPGISHSNAHAIATKQYNYQKEVDEYYGNLSKNKKSK